MSRPARNINITWSRKFLQFFPRSTESQRHGSNLSSYYIVPIHISLILQNGICVESLRSHVRSRSSATSLQIFCLAQWRALGAAPGKTFTDISLDYSYNKYLSVAARTVRRSLKDDKRLAAERRGEMELRFAKWNVSDSSSRGIKLWEVD